VEDKDHAVKLMEDRTHFLPRSMEEVMSVANTLNLSHRFRLISGDAVKTHPLQKISDREGRTHMLGTIATTLLPVPFVTVLGCIAGRFNFFGTADRALMTRLVLTWLLPPLLISGILKTPQADLLDYRIPLIFLVGLMIPYLVVLLVCRFLLGYDQRAATLKKAGLLAFPDIVFMGIPILGRLFGPAGLFPILIANLVRSRLTMPLTSVLLELGSGTGNCAKRRIFVMTLARTWREPQSLGSFSWGPAGGARYRQTADLDQLVRFDWRGYDGSLAVHRGAHHSRGKGSLHGRSNG
jgi:hypothetical protein